jgi:hypothetical protein
VPGLSESSWRAGLQQLCAPVGLSFLSSEPPHLSFREENSPRSRAQFFLWDFPENPQELAKIPWRGVSFPSVPRPSLVLNAPHGRGVHN